MNQREKTNKEILTEKEMLSKLMKGIEKVYGPVSSTLGAMGGTVLIEDNGGYPYPTKDGVTVARYIELEDNVEALGASLVKAAAAKTVAEAGDGTTTTTVLLYNLAKELIKYRNVGLKPTLMRNALEELTEEVVKSLDKLKVDVNTKEELVNIAKLSANGDEEIGDMIGDIVDKLGHNCTVKVEMSDIDKTNYKIIPGNTIESGLFHPVFVTDTKKMQCEFRDPLVVIDTKEVTTFESVFRIVEMAMESSKPLIYIAPSFDGHVAETFITNVTKMKLPIAILKSPYNGDNRANAVEDLACCLGATLISETTGVDHKNFDQSHFGSCDLFIGKLESSSFIEGKGDIEQIKTQRDYLEHLANMTTQSWDEREARERLARFIGGAALINVGGKTEMEVREKKDRVDDALAATKSAKEEGIVAGGGVTLVKLAHTLEVYDCGSSEEARLVKEAFKKSLKAPLLKMLNNAGKSGEVVLHKVENSDKGYNVMTEEYVDLLEEGIIDPVKVTRAAIKNSVAVAKTLVTTSYTITPNKDGK